MMGEGAVGQSQRVSDRRSCRLMAQGSGHERLPLGKCGRAAGLERLLHEGERGGLVPGLGDVALEDLAFWSTARRRKCISPSIFT